MLCSSLTNVATHSCCGTCHSIQYSLRVHLAQKALGIEPMMHGVLERQKRFVIWGKLNAWACAKVCFCTSVFIFDSRAIVCSVYRGVRMCREFPCGFFHRTSALFIHVEYSCDICNIRAIFVKYLVRIYDWYTLNNDAISIAYSGYIHVDARNDWPQGPGFDPLIKCAINRFLFDTTIHRIDCQ